MFLLMVRISQTIAESGSVKLQKRHTMKHLCLNTSMNNLRDYDLDVVNHSQGWNYRKLLLLKAHWKRRAKCGL